MLLFLLKLNFFLLISIPLIINFNFFLFNFEFNTISFFEYSDSRILPTYIPSVISNTVKQHYKTNPWLEKEAVFLHDCDMIFTKQVDFSDLN